MKQRIFTAIFIVAVFFCFFFIYSISIAGTVTVYNDCQHCSSIQVIMTVPAIPGEPSYEIEQNLGDYGNSIAFDAPHDGIYMIYAYCLSGITKEWYDSVSVRQFYVTNPIFLDCFLPTTSTSSIGDLVILNHVMTRSVDVQRCTLPTPTDTFYQYDEIAYSWSSVNNASTTNVVTWKWYQPGGTLYLEDSWINTVFTGHGCVWYPLFINGYVPATLLGDWRVDVYWDGIMKFSDSFKIVESTNTTSSSSIPVTTSIRSTTTTPVYIYEHMMTLDPKMNSGCSLPVPTVTFYDYHKAAYCWFFYDGATIEDEIRVSWYNPRGNLYNQSTGTYSYVSGCWWFPLYISGYDVGNLPGNWRVDVYFDKGDNFTEYFEIVDTTPPLDLCPLSLIYGQNSNQAGLLRNFRDNILSKTQEGRELIKLYYQWSPYIVSAMEADDDFKQEVKDMVDEVLEVVDGVVE